MLILVINSGSSSIKYRLFDMPAGTERVSGLAEGIGESKGRLHVRDKNGTSSRCLAFASHRQGLESIFATLGALPENGFAVGHRFVHGGSLFQESVRVNDRVAQQLESLQGLAPLHNPPNLQGILACKALWPEVLQIAVFDTAFHQSLPSHAYTYALPLRLSREHGLRRYGFHGISVLSALKQSAAFLDRPIHELNLIVLHLGNGASITAIQAGRSVDTSMGMTPLAGLMMGSRCGDIDPGLLLYLQQHCGLDTDELEALLIRDSGFKGLCGDNDLRHIQARASQGDADAKLALAMYAHQIKKYIGAYYAELGRVDALVFTGGIGENATEIRFSALQGLETLGIEIDAAQNAATLVKTRAIHRGNSRVAILVVPANEEKEIAEQTYQLVTNAQPNTAKLDLNS